MKALILIHWFEKCDEVPSVNLPKKKEKKETLKKF